MTGKAPQLPVLNASAIAIVQKTLLLWPGLASATRTVGGALLDHYNRQTGQCDPGLDRLAKLTGLARRTVVNSVDELDALGLFVRDIHGGKFGRNAYRPKMGTVRTFINGWDARMKTAEPPPKTAKQARKDKVGGCRKLHHEQCRNLHLGSAENCTQTYSINLSKEPTATEPEKPTSPQVENAEGARKGNQASSLQSLLSRSLPSIQKPTRATTAREQAERRIHDYFHGRGPRTYEAFCEAATPGQDAYENAVSAEMSSRGKGLTVMETELIGKGV